MEIGDVFWYIAVAYWIYSLFGGKKKPKLAAEKNINKPDTSKKPKANQPIDSKELDWLKKINPELYKQFTGQSADEIQSTEVIQETREEKFVKLKKESNLEVDVLDYETTPKEKWRSKYKPVVYELSKRQLLEVQEKTKSKSTPIDGIIKNKSLLKQAFIFSEILKPKF